MPGRLSEADADNFDGIEPCGRKTFVFVYMDDVLVFSETLTDHLQHLQLVIQQLQDAGLKLKPSKYRFVREDIQFLGHVLTPTGVI